MDLKYFNSRNKILFKYPNKIIFCPRGYDKIYNQDLIIKFLKKNFSKLKNLLLFFQEI